MNGRAPNWPHIGLALVVIGGLIAAPQILTGGVAQNLAILSILYAVVASNWDLTLGYAGIFNFAHVAFFGIGSYVAAISTLQFGVPVWWDLALAVVVVMVVSGVVSSLALRLRGIYVALVMIAADAAMRRSHQQPEGYYGGAGRAYRRARPSDREPRLRFRRAGLFLRSRDPSSGL